MEAGALEKKIEKLPENLKQKVESYIDALLMGQLDKNIVSEPLVEYKPIRTPKPILESGNGTFGKMTEDINAPADKAPKLRREFGSLKGFITYRADDFDAPLEDFKDYV